MPRQINLGGAFVSFRAKADQFHAAMRRSGQSVRDQEQAFRHLRQTVRQTSESFRDFRSSVVSLRGPVNLLSGMHALGLLIRRQAEFGSTLNQTSRQVRFAVDCLKLLGPAFQDGISALKTINEQLKQFKTGIGAVGKLREALEALAKAQAGVGGRSRVEGHSIESIRESLEDENRRLAAANRLVGKKGDELFLARVENKAYEARANLEKALRDATSSGSPSPVVDRLNDEQRILNQLIDTFQNGTPQEIRNAVNTHFQQESDELKKLQEKETQLKKMTAQLAEQKMYADQIAKTLSRGLEEGLLTGKKLSEVFKGIGLSLAKMFLRAVIFKPLEKAFSNSLRGLGRASGGPVRAGGLYRVGERGEEWFLPAMAGTIIPHHQVRTMQDLKPRLAPAAPAIEFHQSFQIESTDGPGVQAALAAALPHVVRATSDTVKGEIRAGQMRPSPFNRGARPS